MRWRSDSPDSIQHDGETIPYRLVHRPRVTRRVHLELGADGGLVVVVPRAMSRRDVRKALQARSARVVYFLAQARSRREDLPNLEYREGETHLFLGEACRLTIVDSPAGRGKLVLENGVFVAMTPDTTSGALRECFRRWYREQAGRDFSRRLSAICRTAPWTQDRIPDLRLRRMKRTWGNCSSAGVITLNPHLVKAPPELIDYVIAHEVCHLCEHNHGSGFYALQEQLFPGWRRARTRLRERGHIYLHE